MNLTFEYGLVPVINKPNKPTRVTKYTAAPLDTGIIKLDVLDHFPIFLIAGTENRITPEGKVEITKRLINSKTKKKFKNALQKRTRNDVISSKQTDSAYEAFFNKFTFLYDKVFEKFVVTVKSKTLKNPWITKLIVKSSKTKQRLCDQFLK